jgi:hypothetical protein
MRCELDAERVKWSNHYTGPDGFIRAWTFVPNEIVDRVLSGEITECPIEMSEEEPLFRTAYAWMMDRMDESGIIGRKSGFSPWWCWLKASGDSAKPTTQHSDEGSTLLELRLKPDQVLFSDFSMWHVVLNYWLNVEDEIGDAFDEALARDGLSIYTTKPLPEPYHSQVQDSWRDIFRLDFVNGFTHEFAVKSIQGVYWKLTPEMIVGVVEPDVCPEEIDD